MPYFALVDHVIVIVIVIVHVIQFIIIIIIIIIISDGAPTVYWLFWHHHRQVPPRGWKRAVARDLSPLLYLWRHTSDVQLLLRARWKRLLQKALRQVSV